MTQVGRKLRKPRFRIGNRVRIIEFDFSRRNIKEYHTDGKWTGLDMDWSYPDQIRRDKLGKVGEVVEVGSSIYLTRPYQVSPIFYYVKFQDGMRINFAEEELKRTRSKLTDRSRLKITKLVEFERSLKEGYIPWTGDSDPVKNAECINNYKLVLAEVRRNERLKLNKKEKQ